MQSRPEDGVPGRRARPVRVEAREARRPVRGEDVEAAVVHVGQELGCALFGRFPRGRLDRDPPGLAAAGDELVPERGERDAQLLVVPGDEDERFLAHELMVADRGEPDPEPAAHVLGDRDLDDAAVLAGLDPAALPEGAALERLEEDGLAAPAAVEEETGFAADRDGRLFRFEQERQLEGGLGLAGDEEVEAVLGRRAEIVLRFVEQAIGPGAERRDGDRGNALVVVFGRALGRLGAFLPHADDGRRVHGLPTRPQQVAGRRRIEAIVRTGADGERLVGREKRFLRLDELDDAPRALAGFGRAVEIGPHDREFALGVGAQEFGVRRGAGLDADEAQAEGARSRAGLAAFVRDVGRERVAIGEAGRRGVLPLVGAGRELDGERAVGVDLGPAAGHGLAAGAAGLPPAPPPPARVDRLALDLPDRLAAGDGEPEVIAGLALERRGLVEAQGLLGVFHSDFEGRPLVFLDADGGVAFGGRAQAPAAEGPAGRRDDELAARGAEGVGRDRGLGDALAVDVLEPDAGLASGFGRDAAEVRASLVGQDLPVELLAGAVDRAVGVDERGPRFPGLAVLAEVEAVGVDDDVPALLGQQEERAAAVARGEPGPAVGVGLLRLDLGVALAPVVGVEVDRGPGDGTAGGAGEDQDFGSADIGRCIVADRPGRGSPARLPAPPPWRLTRTRSPTNTPTPTALLSSLRKSSRTDATTR